MIGRLVLRILIALVVLAVLVASLHHSIHTSEEANLEPEDFDQRYLTYVAGSGEGPTFRTMEGTGRFRILSFLHLPDAISPEDYDPEQRFVYGLRIRVLEDDQTVDTRDVWIVTRTSRLPDGQGGWEQRGSYYPLGAATTGEPADPRLVDIDLSGVRAPGRLVRIEMIPSGEQPDLSSVAEGTVEEGGPIRAGTEEANIVAFREFERQESTRNWHVHTLSDRRTETFGRRARLAEWTQPTDGEIDAMLMRGWRRQTTAEDVPSRSLYTTDYRRSDRDAVGSWETLEPHRARAYSLEGPVRFELGVAGDKPRLIELDSVISGLESEDETWPIELHQTQRMLEPVDNPDRIVPDDQSRQMQWLSVDVGDGEAASIQVRIAADDEDDVQLISRIDRPEAAAGDAPIFRRGDSRYQIAADGRRFDVWETRPEPSEAVRFQLRRNQFQSGDALRLSVRHRPHSDSSTEDRPGELHYRFAGTDIEGSLPMQTDRSPFESIVLPVWTSGADSEDESGDVYDFDGAPDAVSDVSTHRFWIPDGAEALEVWTSDGHRAWVSAAAMSLDYVEQSQWSEPYDRIPPGFRWRYAPVDETSWLSIGPDNARSLIEQRRRRRVRAQVRWKPRWTSARGQQLLGQFDEETRQLAEDRWGAEEAMSAEVAEQAVEELDATVVRPVGARLGRLVLEPLVDVDARIRRQARQRWDGSWRAGLQRGQPLRCAASHGSTVDVEYRLDRQAAGATLEIRGDGEILRRQRLLSATGRRSVPIGTSPQTLEVQLVDDTGEPVSALESEQWWTDCRPEAGQNAALWRLRRVYSLSEERPLVIRASSDDEQQRYINIVAYLEEPTARLQAIVDDGDPGGRATGTIEQITAPTRQFELESSMRTATFPGPQGQRLYGPVRVAVPLGSDWETGTHDIRLQLDDGTAIWTRFFEYE